MENENRFLCEAIALARANVAGGGRPFGAVVVRNGAIIASGVNEVLSTNDPTAHAELLAIRAASQALGSASLAGCAVYASGQPCPMCMAAMRLAGVEAVAYAWSNEDAAPFGLSTAAIQAELARPHAGQTMNIRHIPVGTGSAPDAYVAWGRLQQANPAGGDASA